MRWVGEGTESCGLGNREWAPRNDVCFYPIDLRLRGKVEIVRRRHGQREVVRLRIGDYPYPIQRIQIADDGMVHLSPENLQRVREENRRIAALWRRAGSSRFSLPLLPPLEPLPTGGRFGARRIINGEPRNPHTGADYAADEGTPVKAAADAVVALAEEHFFGGKSVFLDHGAGLITMYLHLREILVRKDEPVRGGEVIGRVGATGRVTGPHLHFGIRWHGARVDPGLLLAPPEEMLEIP